MGFHDPKTKMEPRSKNETPDEIAEGEQWVEDGKSIRLNADATAGEDCTADTMYCDQTEGVCSAEEIASTEEPSSGDGGEGEASGCATQSLAAAAVVAILSA